MEPWGLAELLMALSVCVNLLCLYLLWARAQENRLRPPGTQGRAVGGQPGEAEPPHQSASKSATTMGGEAEPPHRRLLKSATTMAGEAKPPLWESFESATTMAADPEENEHCQLADSKKSVEEDDSPFLEEFSAKREEIKAYIWSIRKIADDIDETHKECVITSITASVMGATSETLNALGSTLTPHSASGSLSLTATALGFRVGETVLSVFSSLYENAVNLMRKEKARVLINQCTETLQKMKGSDEPGICSNLVMSDQADIMKYLEGVKESIPAIYNNVRGIQANIKTLHCVQADPRLKTLAKQATAASEETRGNIEGVKEVNEKCAGTNLAKNKEERLYALGFAACDLVAKVNTIFQCCQHLSSGAKTEVAAAIRAKAMWFEEALEKLTEGGKQPRRKFCRKLS